jgi:hypothetical protein
VLYTDQVRVRGELEAVQIDLLGELAAVATGKSESCQQHQSKPACVVSSHGAKQTRLDSSGYSAANLE